MNYQGYETSYTSYGAGGGAGGGGFMPGEGSQQSPGGGRRDYGQDSMRPVTIKQLLEAQIDGASDKDTCRIDGSLVTQFTFVGQIRNISAQTTNTTYRLDDGTGSIEVKKWVTPDEQEKPNSSDSRLTEGAYCRAWGKLRSFGERRSVASQIIRPIDDMNEVNYHLLDATAVHLHFTRGPPNAANAGAGAGTNGAGQQQAGGATYGGYDLSGYSQIAKRVFQHLRESPQTNEGIHQQEIAAKLGIDTADVARAGDDLLSGGFIYTTVDDQTWAILEAD